MNLKKLMEKKQIISDAQANSFYVGNGFGKKIEITPSQDDYLNQLFGMVSSSVSIKRPTSVDNLFSINENGNYELHVWNIFGRPFEKDVPYCSLVTNKNNTDIRLEFRGSKSGVQIWFTKRGNYGMGDTEKRIF